MSTPRGERYAVFVDVGYAVASAAELLTGEPGRHRVRADVRQFLAGLTAEVSRRSTLSLLRVYWYDASTTGRPEHDQRDLARLPGVRLRLGRLVRGVQKGVDSRIVRDLIVLARDGAISEAWLVAGDEDLVEGVQEAQDQGVRVGLLGVPGINQSGMLIGQSDEWSELPETFWRSYFTAAPEEAGAPAASAETVLPALDGGAEDGFLDAAREAGAAYAREWRQESTLPALERLLRQTGWLVPPDIDRRLLFFANERLGGRLWERSELKIAIRQSFWRELRAVPPAETNASVSR